MATSAHFELTISTWRNTRRLEMEKLGEPHGIEKLQRVSTEDGTTYALISPLIFITPLEVAGQKEPCLHVVYA